MNDFISKTMYLSAIKAKNTHWLAKFLTILHTVLLLDKNLNYFSNKYIFNDQRKLNNSSLNGHFSITIALNSLDITCVSVKYLQVLWENFKKLNCRRTVSYIYTNYMKMNWIQGQMFYLYNIKLYQF